MESGGGNEADLILKNLPVIFLCVETLKIIKSLLLDIGLGENSSRNLGQGGIAGPDFGGGPQFSFQRGSVAGCGGRSGLGQVQRTDRPGGFNRGHRLGAIKVPADRFQFLNQGPRSFVILHLQGGKQLIRLAGELQHLAFFCPGQEPDFRQILANGESLAETLRGTLEFAFLEKKGKGLHPLPHIPDRLIGQGIELAEGLG